MHSAISMLLVHHITLESQFILREGGEPSSNSPLFFLTTEAGDTPISFSPILGPLKCLLPLVLPLLVASWCTILLDFPYLVLPAFQWRSTSHSISEKGKSQATRKTSGTGSVLFYYQTSMKGERLR